MLEKESLKNKKKKNQEHSNFSPITSIIIDFSIKKD